MALKNKMQPPNQGLHLNENRFSFYTLMYFCQNNIYVFHVGVVNSSLMIGFLQDYFLFSLSPTAPPG